jgi:hypothetical protein
MTAHSSIYVGDNTHIVEVVDLQDNLGVVETAATVQMVSVLDRLGVAVSGVTVPLALAHIASGTYRATLPHGGAFVAGQIYKAKITAVGSQSFRAEWVETLIARTRAA